MIQYLQVKYNMLHSIENDNLKTWFFKIYIQTHHVGFCRNENNISWKHLCCGVFV